MKTPPAPFAEIPGTEEYLEVSIQALQTSSGSEALDLLGYWDLLNHLDDPDARAAIFSFFRAQGRQLAESSALGGLLAQPFIGANSSVAAGAVIATVARQSSRRGVVQMVVGDLGSRQLLVDRPGEGVSIVPPEGVVLRSSGVPGKLLLSEVEVDWAMARPLLAEAEAIEPRRRSSFLGRLALAAEILGAAEGALALAVEYAGNREQFGQPIGRFQAVRHLLAWASADCTAIEAVVLKGVFLDQSTPPMFGEIVKALAGRNGRKACERTLQVLGGIGFTREHDHHHHHSRILALDALLGTSAELTNQLGSWLRTADTDPRFAQTILLPARA
jgi:hypothetical protein